MNLTVDDYLFLLSFLQDGFKPIEVAALRDNLEVVEHLLPLTSPIPGVSNWTVDGIVKYVSSKMEEEKVPLLNFLYPRMFMKPLYFANSVNFYICIHSTGARK